MHSQICNDKSPGSVDETALNRSAKLKTGELHVQIRRDTKRTLRALLKERLNRNSNEEK